MKKFRKLQNELAEFREIGDSSIYSCHACGKADRDMIFNKSYGTWYCFECYDQKKTFMRKFFKNESSKE